MNSPMEQSENSNRTDNRTRTTVSREARKTSMLSFVRENPKASYQEIAAGTGVFRSTVGIYLKGLIKDGLLERVGNNKSGYWKIFDVAALLRSRSRSMIYRIFRNPVIPTGNGSTLPLLPNS